MVRETMVGDPFSRCNVDNTRIRDEEYLRNYYVTVPSVAYFASPPLPRGEKRRRGKTTRKENGVW